MTPDARVDSALRMNLVRPERFAFSPIHCALHRQVCARDEDAVG